MRFLKHLMVALLLAVGSTACIQINEEITLAADESGQMSWTMDMKGLRTLMESMGGGDTGETSGKMDSTFQEMKVKLEAVPGISNVQQVSQADDMTFGVSFNFQNLAALNQAMAVIKDGKENSKQKDELVMGKKKLTRSVANPNMGGDTDLANMKDSDLEMAKMFLDGANYNMVIHLPRKAKKASNKYAKIEDGGKTVRVTVPLMDILSARGKLDLSNTVSF
jgi:hypothetical protein